MSDLSRVPKEVIMLLWDVDLTSLNLEEHSSLIIERVLNMGEEVALKWIWHTYGQETIKETVQKSRKLSLKTARCWQNYFNLKEEQMRCFSTYSMSLGRLY